MQTKVKKTPAAFLRSTYDILMKGQFESIVSWAQGGTAFVIKDLPRFEVEILPKYFKHHKFSSFVRQLNMYGFHKHRYSEHQNTFMHDRFRRDEDRLVEIRRKPETKKKSKQARSDQTIIKIEKGNISVEQTPESQQEQSEQSQISQPKQEHQESVVVPSSLNDVCRSLNQFTAQDQCCMKLCELLLVQNRILARKQFDFRSTVLNYKKKDIALQKESIQTIERLTTNEGDEANPQQSNRLTLINQNMRRLDNRLQEQIHFMAQFTAEMNSLTKELVDTNYSMFSTTSIEEGYSTMKIEEANRN